QGFGIDVVPLNYVGATEMERLLKPMAPDGAILRVDPARNLLVIAGTVPERAQLLDTIASFDVDTMAGMSFGVFPLNASDAKSMVADLKTVFANEGGGIADLIRLVPVQRMNAVIAITPQARYLDRVRNWIDQLDVPNEVSERKIYVYTVQHGRAKDLA